MVGKSNQNVFLIQINASSFAEFDISEFEIARVVCKKMLLIWGSGHTNLLYCRKVEVEEGDEGVLGEALVRDRNAASTSTSNRSDTQLV